MQPLHLNALTACILACLATAGAAVVWMRLFSAGREPSSPPQQYNSLDSLKMLARDKETRVRRHAWPSRAKYMPLMAPHAPPRHFGRQAGRRLAESSRGGEGGAEKRVFEVRARDLSERGVGIAVASGAEGRVRGDGTGDGRVVFVPGLLPGERALVRVVHVGQRSTQAEIVEMMEESPDRRRPPPCPLSGTCGGCQLLDLTDEAQRAWKKRRLIDTLERIGGLSPGTVDVRGPVTAGAALGYRNKAVVPVALGEEGRIDMGFYEQGSHKVVPTTQCLTLDPRLDEMLAPLLEDLRRVRWPVYDETTGASGVRHLALRVGQRSGERLITVIASDDSELDGLDQIAEMWMRRWPDVVGVCINLQPERNNRLFGSQTLVVAGQPQLTDVFGGMRFSLGPASFFQVNSPVAEAVLPFLSEALLKERSGWRLIDAYGGIGTLMLPLAREDPSHQWVGIEVNPAAVEDARRSAKLNGLDNVRCFQGLVSDVLPKHISMCDGLLLDPPRKGLDDGVAELIASTPPRAIAYLSCNPATLARDLKVLLKDDKLRLRYVVGFDFFPQTTHLEALAVMERVDD